MLVIVNTILMISRECTLDLTTRTRPVVFDTFQCTTTSNAEHVDDRYAHGDPERSSERRSNSSYHFRIDGERQEKCDGQGHRGVSRSRVRSAHRREVGLPVRPTALSPLTVVAMPVLW